MRPNRASQQSTGGGADHASVQLANASRDLANFEPSANGARRLLIVVNVAWFFFSHRLPIALAAKAAGYDVHVVSGAESDQERRKFVSHGLKFHEIPLSRGGANPLRDWTTIRAMAAAFRTVSPDIAHLVTIKPLLYGGLLSRFMGVQKVICAVSGLGYVFVAKGIVARLRRWLLSKLLRVSIGHANAHVILQNTDDLEELRTRGILQHCTTHLIKGSGVDLEGFRPHPEVSGTPRVLLPARLLIDKGIREFCAAADLLAKRDMDCEFVLAGPLDPHNPSGISRPELQKLIQSGHVIWMGQQDDMPDVLRNSHVVVLPSYREGLPKALIEAAAAGRPIVTTDVPGCRDVVEGGVSGIIVPVRDAAALADAIEELLASPELRRTYGLAGRRKAEAEFGVKAVVAQTLALYESNPCREGRSHE
jgi:glycosyltransferase involved in cell wall biosynthesis